MCAAGRSVRAESAWDRAASWRASAGATTQRPAARPATMSARAGPAVYHLRMLSGSPLGHGRQVERSTTPSAWAVQSACPATPTPAWKTLRRSGSPAARSAPLLCSNYNGCPGEHPTWIEWPGLRLRLTPVALSVPVGHSAEPAAGFATAQIVPILGAPKQSRSRSFG